jgi:putative ABC transport system substrate-binding protein
MMRRRTFIAGLGSTTVCPLAARAQQPERMRRIGVLMPGDENDPVWNIRPKAFTQALADLGWTDGRTCGLTFVGPAETSIGYERSRRSWSVCNPISS